jgi:hypothetical protein
VRSRCLNEFFLLARMQSGDYGDSALNSLPSFIAIVRRSVSGSQHRENGGFRRRQRIPKWRATADEDGHYCFAVAL